MTSRPRTLSWSDCVNVRDLGGLPTRGRDPTRFGAIVRSDSPHRLTPDGRRALEEYGITTIVDIREPHERARDGIAFADGGPVRTVFVPLHDQASLAAIRGIDGRLAYNVTMLEHARANLAAAVRAIAAAPAGAVLFHCAVGKDRSGIVAALVLAVAGVESDAIAGDYATSEERLTPLRDEMLATADPARRDGLRTMWGAPRADMLGTLACLEERHGGAARYLATAGVGDAELARVAERLA